MGGPVAVILLRDALSEVNTAEVRAEILAAAERIEGDDFWIDRRPFYVCFGEEYPGDLEDSFDDGLPDVLGWKPKGLLAFGTVCKQQKDQRILAELCVMFGRKLDGIIALAGPLPLGPSLDGPTSTPPVRVENPNNLRGVLFATSSLTANGVYRTSHYADTTLMESWIKDSRFHLVK